MKTYGIIGNPLGHSFSKQYFTDKFHNEEIDAQFLNFEIPSIEKILNVVQDNPSLLGLCVTIPYKEEVMAYLDEIDPLAKKIGAVNSIQIRRKDGRTYLKGYNTDIYGFGESLADFIEGKKLSALILGTGGASKAVATALKNQDIEFISVSRKRSDTTISYEDLNEEIISNHQLIINCTPLGTFPNTDACPNLLYSNLNSEYFLYDLVYNPATTLFMSKGIEHKAKTHNGLKMLHLQAEKSWEIWNE
ncbi:shikimate dehydrogenase [Ancylomarina euxinus]|uniref:Shikimate dehydrogenase n=1 Tax=Ancylomarina euxinus TaxID=2283627 RepID=A0A425Y432_9BACT|nr:shikimate dehydrogenase [Ancylomarina euxinus]MCZ4694648.1 shikimate dehydrogenase [Ancylomarina euxinus]MUP14193.1 shikimate dehydrogenase [Ancylomarina euxinus]RRG23045.1 shikimate dehydrogenase [Ancylomarina euxinus]